MNLYLVRHGQSEGNVAKIHQPGHSPLTEKGLRQAASVGERFKHVEIDVLFSSPFKRAEQTSQSISNSTGRKIHFSDDLREMMPPSMVVGLHEDHPDAKKVMDVIKDKFHDTSFKHSDEDTFTETKERVQHFLEEISKSDYKNVVCVTHGLVLRMIVGLVLFGDEFTPREFDKLFYNAETKNTGVSLCRFEEGKWILRTWNDYSHWME